jgi:transposase
VHDYLQLWDWDGTLLRLHHALYVQARELAGREARQLFLFIKRLFADGAYQGATTATAVSALSRWELVEVVKRSNQAQGFVVLPKRWIVERTFAWLGRCRRLSKDFETLTRTALAFLRLAMIRLMLRRIARPLNQI